MGVVDDDLVSSRVLETERAVDSTRFDLRRVVLDPRIQSKPYGRVFLESLPDCQRVEESVTYDPVLDETP